MPSRAAHLRQARHNEEFLNYVSRSSAPYHDWRAVLLFYISLHYVDAVLAQRNLHPGSHSQRSEMVYLHLRRIVFDYRTLRDASEHARYDLIEFSDDDIQRLEQGAFTRVRSYLRARLNLPE